MSVPSGATTYMIFRLQIDKELTSLGDIAATIEKTGGDIVGIDVISSGRTSTVRDITVNVSDQTHSQLIDKSLQV